MMCVFHTAPYTVRLTTGVTITVVVVVESLPGEGVEGLEEEGQFDEHLE